MNRCSLRKGNPNACINCADYYECPESVESIIPRTKKEEVELTVKKPVLKKTVKKGKGKK